MKLITLNIWGGKLLEPLKEFVTHYAKEVDIFCFQEVYASPFKRTIAREMYSDVYGELSRVLPDHNGYFAAHLKQETIDGKSDFTLASGLALFIRKSFEVQNHGDIFVHRKGFSLINDDYTTIPRNIQYVSCKHQNTKYVIAHFHGIWYPKTKLDTSDRLQQSNKIKSFLDAQSGKKILCGDFNVMPDTKSLQVLEKNMRNLIKTYNVKTTRNDLYTRSEKFADYVLISPDVKVREFKVLSDTVSDHLPLYVEFEQPL